MQGSGSKRDKPKPTPARISISSRRGAEAEMLEICAEKREKGEGGVENGGGGVRRKGKGVMSCDLA